MNTFHSAYFSASNIDMAEYGGSYNFERWIPEEVADALEAEFKTTDSTILSEFNEIF